MPENPYESPQEVLEDKPLEQNVHPYEWVLLFVLGVAIATGYALLSMMARPART